MQRKFQNMQKESNVHFFNVELPKYLLLNTKNVFFIGKLFFS